MGRRQQHPPPQCEPLRPVRSSHHLFGGRHPSQLTFRECHIPLCTARPAPPLTTRLLCGQACRRVAPPPRGQPPAPRPRARRPVATAAPALCRMSHLGTAARPHRSGCGQPVVRPKGRRSGRAGCQSAASLAAGTSSRRRRWSRWPHRARQDKSGPSLAACPQSQSGRWGAAWCRQSWRAAAATRAGAPLAAACARAGRTSTGSRANRAPVRGCRADARPTAVCRPMEAAAGSGRRGGP
mmetsp:Transcript_26638/g.86049  ORF Transcript_26638/g.86049 Transcript_26638/m.86049 type:complete len:239 (-) Transcript_26638:301-1017(-)|eukprot:scaffold16006_cov110-Isochrysis_galbana.AAC.1